MALLGIFWYDENKRELTAVYSTYEDDIPPFQNGKRSFPILHRDIWIEKHRECYNQYGEIKPGYEDSIFLEPDYTLVPRGRVSSDSEGYQVYIGDWIDYDFDYIKSLILYEFGLLEDETDFIHDVHWNIGHGWSE